MGRSSGSEYREELWIQQLGICAWPPCSKSLGDIADLTRLDTRQTIHVDHNHRCCDDWRTCGKCVRGLVHASCNITDIKWMDAAIARGFDPPLGSIRDYLFIGEVNCRGESYLGEGDYDPKVISAESYYEYESSYHEQDIRLRRLYPFFTAQVFDGLSIMELTKLGPKRQSRRTVMYRLKLEKEAFLSETADAAYHNRHCPIFPPSIRSPRLSIPYCAHRDCNGLG